MGGFCGLLKEAKAFSSGSHAISKSPNTAHKIFENGSTTTRGSTQRGPETTKQNVPDLNKLSRCCSTPAVCMYQLLCVCTIRGHPISYVAPQRSPHPFFFRASSSAASSAGVFLTITSVTTSVVRYVSQSTISNKAALARSSTS